MRQKVQEKAWNWFWENSTINKHQIRGIKDFNQWMEKFLKKYKTSGSNKEGISEQNIEAIGSSFEWDFKIIFMKNIS